MDLREGKVWVCFWLFPVRMEKFGFELGQSLGSCEGENLDLRREKFGFIVLPVRGNIWNLREEKFGFEGGKIWI